MNVVKGYKVFNPDWTCRGKQYSCPGMFEESVALSICKAGMHFCKKAIDCFEYYPFNPSNHIAEVIAHGEIAEGQNKCCTNKLEIVREIPWTELLEIVNTGKGCSGIGNSGNGNSGNENSGDRNSGDRNSGNWNSGYRNSGNENSGNENSGYRNSGYRNSGNGNSGNENSGYRNSGDRNSGNENSGYRNSGDRNSGNWNSGNWNSGYRNSGNWNSGNWNSGHRNSGDWNKTNFSNGCFNTVEPKIYLFNKPSKWTYADWLNSKACYLLCQPVNGILDWVEWSDMTDDEKKKHPESQVTGGYLKKLDKAECMRKWWQSLSESDKEDIMSIPNFDKEIFKEITGIEINYIEMRGKKTNEHRRKNKHKRIN